MKWKDVYFDYALFSEGLVMAGAGLLAILMGTAASQNLYLWEIFSAFLAASITTFGLKHMKRLTS